MKTPHDRPEPMHVDSNGLWEHRYLVFTELSADFFHTCTRHKEVPYRLQWIGGKFEQITGYSIAELMELGCWLKLVHPDDQQRVATALSLLTPGTVNTNEFRLIRKDHAIRWIREASRCEQDPNDAEQLVLYGTCRDITVSRETAQALKTAESAYRTIFNAANDTIFVMDPHTGVLLDCNNRAQEMFGRPRHEIIGATPDQLSPPHSEEFNKTNALIRIKTAIDGQPQLFEWQCQRGDGALFWSEVNLRATEINGRKRLLAVVRDITERRQMEEQLLRSQFALDHNTDPIFWANENGGFIYANEAACRSLGYSLEELLKLRVADIDVQHPDAARFEQFVSPLEQGGAITIESVHRRKNGSVYPVEVAISLLSYANNRYVCGIARDITERQKAAEELRLSTQAAASASRAKSEFLANMSHEVRTPLNGIMGMAQLLRMTGLTSEQQKFMNMLDESCQTLLSLINDILDISRIEAGRLAIEELPFCLHTLVEQVVQAHRSVALHKGLALEVELDPDLPNTLLGDQLRLKQVLLNLLGNAVKFTAQGSVRLAITQDLSSPTQPRLQLCVSDTGIGIDDEALGRIFEHFTQADASTTRLYGGSGLGLTICRRLAELMGGTIWAESELGRGSRFHVELPLKPAPEELEPLPPRHETSKSLATDAAPACRAEILLVEDQDVGRIFATAILERKGQRVTPALDGLMALELLARQRFDLVLLDIELPNLRGEEVLARLRGLEGCARLPVIAMTAHALAGDREALLGAGFDGYCAKPLEIEQLQQELERVLQAAPTKEDRQ